VDDTFQKFQALFTILAIPVHVRYSLAKMAGVGMT